MTQAVLELRELVKRFGGLAATDHLNLTVHAGEIHALIGPNGAGKTTLIHQISGAIVPDSGRILFDGKEVTRMPMHDRVTIGLARSYQITNIFNNLSVLDNLALAVQARAGSSMRFWRPVLSEQSLFDEAYAIARQIGLGNRTGFPGASLAHGEKRRLELGLALATKPKLLLLDEPMAGMGQEESAGIVPLIENLRGKVTVLLVEHDMDTVFRVADRISVLVSGRIIATGTPDDIRRNPEVKKAYLGDEVIA
ncbi:MAG: ABC transporter ATP-binding protein [Burkholderiales bacterium RIFCSPLOWO2_02_FULL_57_36]|nr:MAG: ABC transporter ATP-binding protein [Burkholderiales bacterium RIFCSPLOWO2_02_FULL_57_36]